MFLVIFLLPSTDLTPAALHKQRISADTSDNAVLMVIHDRQHAAERWQLQLRGLLPDPTRKGAYMQCVCAGHR